GVERHARTLRRVSAIRPGYLRWIQHLDHRRSPMTALLPEDELRTIDAWWRACNYLTVGQIYLQANPLLTEGLVADQIKPRLLGHWGTSPGLAFVYAHTSRLIRETGQECIYL